MPIQPFDQSGIVRGADGIKRYQGLTTSLVKMLRASVDKAPQSEAIVQVGGGRVTYRQLWDRCARIAGGLKEAGIVPGDCVAIRLGNSLDWCLAFYGIERSPEESASYDLQTRCARRCVESVPLKSSSIAVGHRASSPTAPDVLSPIAAIACGIAVVAEDFTVSSTAADRLLL